MAEASLQIVLGNLDSMMRKELGLLWGLEKEMEKLCSILTAIKAVLEDAEEKQVNDRAITDWLQKLNAAVYKADDILDEWATEASRLERKTSKVHTFLRSFPLENTSFRHKIAKKLVEVIKRLNGIAEERIMFHFNEVVRERRVGFVERRQTGSTQPRVVYGRDEDKEKVVKCLVEDIIDCDDVSVYPIVGMGGLGKTTLAQLVFNDERVRRHFETRIWVCVSDDFDVRRLIKAMIESATGNACPDLDLDPLQKRLQELLSGKRFLLVLDDVWSDDQDKWNKLKCVLTSTSKGASIVVTTRMKKVARVMGTLREREHEHNLSSLSENVERLDEIAEERRKFHCNEVVRERCVGIVEWRQTGSIVTQPRVYGRDEDKEKVVKCLVEDIIDCDDVSVYPIVGMGGLGKTTLAHLVYNDERVERHFDLKMWVCVSDDFDVRRLIKAMIESATENACEILDLDPLQKRLQKLLSGKRFLLVLDDVWSDDEDKWNKLKCVLTSTSKGASIVVTTRMKSVAFVMGTLCEHNLSSLSENDCWSLFKERAFSGEREEHPDIIAIGWEIVKNCGGVPLAVQALGSLMRCKSGEKQWLSVMESKIWDLPQDENSILPALRLSYTNLPQELRKCFVYFAIYPKDSVIERNNLIQLWMANGYVELEDVGNEICEELYWRSLIQEVSRDNLGNIETFKMHDLVHDLAQSLIGDECCHVHLISSTSSCTIPETLYAIESLRTLLLTTTWGSSADASHLDFSRLRTLRVFSGYLDNLTIVSSIGNLKHLRYLRLSSFWIKELPVSICSLINLQTLNLDECCGLTTLPKTLSCMKNLRHLHLNLYSKLLSMPPNIGQMRCLKTLSLFIVGNNPGFELVELQCLNLGGDLHIKHLERVVNLTDAKEANFSGKHDLRYLSLSWDLENVLDQPESVEKVLEALKPHSNLQRLELDGYNGTRFPDWMNGGILCNVTSIVIVNCKKLLQLPPLGELPSLKELKIHGAEHISSIDNDGHGDGSVTRFPRLSRLGISECPKLTTLPCLPSVKDFTVSHFHEMLMSSISNMENLTSLCIEGNDKIVELPHEMLQNLTSLESLEIVGLIKLKCLSTELGSLSGLKYLHIADFDELESFPEHALQGLGSLQELSIRKCKKFNSLSEGLQHLTSLERLEIDQCPDLVAFPDGIKRLHSLQEVTLSHIQAFPNGLQYISSLKSLSVDKCPNLVSSLEWLGNLTSLQLLDIDFGTTISSFPSTMQRLTNLKKLIIRCCDPMRKGYEKEIGDKIAHVPDVEIFVD